MCSRQPLRLDRLTADGASSLTQLAAQVALMEAAPVALAEVSPNRYGLLRWLRLAGAEAKHDSAAVQAAARHLAGVLGGQVPPRAAT